MTRLGRSAALLAVDESASVLVEYALVLSCVSILGMIAFNYVGTSAMTAESLDAQNFTNQNRKASP